MTILDLAEKELLEALETDPVSLAGYKARLRDGSDRRYYLDLIEMVTFKYSLNQTKENEPNIPNPESDGKVEPAVPV